MSAELVIDFGVFNFLTDLDRGSNILPEFLKWSPGVKGLVDAIMPEIQELHDAQSDVYSTVNIFEAVGSQLDDIFGEILDLPRELGQTDDIYRTVLLAVIPSIGGSGTIGVVKSVLRDLSEAPTVSLIEVFSHMVIMHAIVDSFGDITDKDLIDTTMNGVKGGGIKLDIGIQEIDNAFIFSEDVGGGTVDGEGFATVAAGDDGGAFARIRL